MKNTNYNNNQLAKISKMIFNKDYDDALKAYQEYIIKYPNDYGVYPGYANLLIKLGQLEEAENIINSFVIDEKTRLSTFKKLTLIKIKLLCSTNRYEECLELVKNNFDLLNEKRISTTEILMFLKNKLGILKNLDYSNYSYEVNQIVSYSEQEAINHIRTNCNIRNPKMIINFYDDFPLEDVYYQIRNILPTEDKMLNDIIYNSYIFKYANNGSVNGLSVNYIKVITLQASNDIITMYPYRNKEKLPYIELKKNEILEEDYSKVKRLSQIEKFNKRYQKN